MYKLKTGNIFEYNYANYNLTTVEIAPNISFVERITKSTDFEGNRVILYVLVIIYQGNQ